MIKLDEGIYVSEPKDVKAIRPVYMRDPRYPETEIINAQECQILINGFWILIKRGPEEIASILELYDDDDKG